MNKVNEISKEVFTLVFNSVNELIEKNVKIKSGKNGIDELLAFEIHTDIHTKLSNIVLREVMDRMNGINPED